MLQRAMTIFAPIYCLYVGKLSGFGVGVVTSCTFIQSNMDLSYVFGLYRKV